MARHPRFYISVAATLLAVSLNATLKQISAQQACRCTDNGIIDCSNLSLYSLEKSFNDKCDSHKKIDLSDNSFKEIPEHLAEFTEINISKNTVKGQMDFPTAMNVQVLNISSNQIQRISFGASVPKLRELYAAHNKLEITFLTGKCNLEVLDVSSNNIENLESATSCPQLGYLDVSDNDIQVIRDGFEKLDKLTNLKLSNNKLTSLSNLPKSLEVLDVSGNELKELLNATFMETDKLKLLIVAHNLIHRIDADTFAGLTQLQQVDLSSNKLTAVPFLNVRDNLESLSMSNNSIRTVSVEAVLPLLGSGVTRHVSLQDNPLQNDDSGLHAFVRYLDTNDAVVTESEDCSCVDATVGATALFLCVNNPKIDKHCWLDVARRTTTTTTTESHVSIKPVDENTEQYVVTSSSDSVTSRSEAMKSNETQSEGQMINVQNISYASHFMSSLGFAKVSFLAFLLLTLAALVVVNCVVGPPVVDDRWWEEKLPGDRIAS